MLNQITFHQKPMTSYFTILLHNSVRLGNTQPAIGEMSILSLHIEEHDVRRELTKGNETFMSFLQLPTAHTPPSLTSHFECEKISCMTILISTSQLQVPSP